MATLDCLDRPLVPWSAVAAFGCSTDRVCAAFTMEHVPEQNVGLCYTIACICEHAVTTAVDLAFSFSSDLSSDSPEEGNREARFGVLRKLLPIMASLQDTLQLDYLMSDLIFVFIQRTRPTLSLPSVSP